MATQTEVPFEVVPPVKQDALERTAASQQQDSAVLAPMVAMIERAMVRGASLEQIEKLIDLRDRLEASDARKAYTEAMSAFKAHSIEVMKDKTNKQYASKYVSLGRLVSTVTPFLSQHGLSANWDVDQSQAPAITVTCKMTHKAGHSESVSMTLPPDKSGAKNPIQEIKSAITYGKACTFESICGLASTDANVDDDGNGAGNNGSGKKMDNLTERLEWIAPKHKRRASAYLFEAVA